MNASLPAPAVARAFWIWAAASRPDEVVRFRRRFTAAQADAEAHVDISADSDFVAFLNGVEFARGQFNDFTGRKTWERFPVGRLLRAGENVLAVIVYYRGEHFSDYQAGPAGLLLRLAAGDEEIVTGADWRVSPHPAFRAGRRERVTPQMGFTVEYDARRAEDGWRELSFDDSRWAGATVVQAGGLGETWRELARRPLPPPRVDGLIPVRVTAQGRFLRPEAKASPAEAIAADALIHEFPWQAFANKEVGPAFDPPAEEGSTRVEEYHGMPPNAGELLGEGTATPLCLRPLPPGTAGRYMIFDLGAEETGLLEFSVTASEGTVLEIAHGEHVDDGRVRASVGTRRFADRYVCRAGEQRFQLPFRRLAARYLELHASGYAELKIHFLTLRRVEYPGERGGSFVVADRFSTRLQEIAVRTLELCRHDHFEDSPWREQSLYAYDTRLQALYGYYAFGDYRFAGVSLDLLGRSIGADGLVALTAPGEVPVSIPLMSFSWAVSVAEHALFSGDDALFRAFRPALERMLGDAYARRDAATGLYCPPVGDHYWNFYEWVPGLCGVIGRPDAPGVLHAAYNLHLHEAIRAFRALRAQAGEATEEEDRILAGLGEAVHRAFWDAEAGFYRSQRTAEGLSGRHELIQALALHEGIVPPAERDRVAAAMTAGVLDRASMSAFYYIARAAMEHSPSTRAWLSRRLTALWEPMIFAGATTMWETHHGGSDFDFAGSLCHGWSALPVWFHQAEVLGIRPTAPGFAEFALSIHPANFAEAKGIVPTPHGPIEIEWQRSGQGLLVEVRGPAACRPRLLPLPETPILQATYNGALLKSEVDLT